MASAMAPTPGAVLVLDELHHSVTTEDLTNFLEENKLQQGNVWDSVIIIKKLQKRNNLRETCYHEDSSHGYAAVELDVSVDQSDSYYKEGTDSKEIEDHCDDESKEFNGNDNQHSRSRSISSIFEEDFGEATTTTVDEVGTLEEEVCNGSDSHAAMMVSVGGGTLYHRGFIICGGVPSALYVLHSLHGLKLIGKELDIKVADGTDLEELLQYEATTQMVPKLLLSCINQRAPHVAMKLPMVKELLRGIKWTSPVGIERVPRTCENLSAGTQYLITPTISEETQKLLHLLREANFYEFKVTANLKPAYERKDEPEVKKNSYHCQSLTIDSEAESGLGTSKSRSNSEGDPSMSYDTSASSLNSAHFNCISAHIVPRTATAYLSPQTALTCFPLRLLLPETFARILIGENMHTIKWIAEKSGASIAVLEKRFFVLGNNWFDKMVVLFGSDDSYQIALKHVLEVLTQEANRLFGLTKLDSVKQRTNELIDDDGLTINVRLVAFNSLTGRLIGKFGKNLKAVMGATNTKITISGTPYTWSEPRTDADRIVLIVGKLQNVLEACYLVTKRLSSSYMFQYKATGRLPGEVMPIACLQPQPQVVQHFASPNVFVPQVVMSWPQQSVPIPLPLARTQSSLALYKSHNGHTQSQNLMHLLPPKSAFFATSLLCNEQ